MFTQERKRPDDLANVLERVAAHLAAGYRLLRRLRAETGTADAILRSDGTFEHLPVLDALSAREYQVLGFAELGHANKFIAYELGITPSTVGVLLSRARQKLGAKSREELIDMYRREVRAAGRREVAPEPPPDLDLESR